MILNEKTALITGASRGIGKETARALAKKGCNLILICQNNIEVLKVFSKELSETYKIAVNAYKCDVSDYSALSEILKKHPSVDIVVNNAGISYVGLLSEMEVSDWNRIVSVNLSSVFNTSRLTIPGMLKKNEGYILNISSVWGNIGASMEVAYSATKGGINSFTKALAKELAPSNITVNALACGFVDTDMNRHLSEEERISVKEQIPADRFAEPEEIAMEICNLLESPSYLTGQVITVDGGWT